MKKEDMKQELLKLRKKYCSLSPNQINSDSEEDVRGDFIDELLRNVLGWTWSDIKRNRTIETKQDAHLKFADYIYPEIPKIIVEAKKFNIIKEKNDESFSKQVLEYAYGKAVNWAILTDFKIFKVWYVTRDEQRAFCNIDLIEDDIDEIINDSLVWLNDENLFNGELERKAVSRGIKLSEINVTEDLAQGLNQIREILNNYLSKSKGNLEEVEELTQGIINRIIFIKKVEALGVEENKLEQLYRVVKTDKYERLKGIFAFYRERYDSDVFGNPDYPSPVEEIEIDDKRIDEILAIILGPNEKMTYNFAAIDSDILGSIYENYLAYIQKGKHLIQTTKKKSQGIYYTPTYIINFIAKSTLNEVLGKSKLSSAKKLKSCDPACGSGSFIIDMISLLYDYYRDNYSKFSSLPLTQKLSLIKDNIYGVDLDEKAIAITELNIYLKILTKEVEQGARQALIRSPTNLLPELRSNILCRNSLIEDKAIAQDMALNWADRFGAASNGYFDVIIGNPPYIDSEEMTRTQLELRKFYTKHYDAAKGNWDMFCIFIERSLKLLKKNGMFGMIVPNKLLSADYAMAIRDFIKQFHIIGIRDYSKIPVFNASVYPIVIIVKKEKHKESDKIKIEVIDYNNGALKVGFTDTVPQDKIMDSKTWSQVFQNSSSSLVYRLMAYPSLETYANVSGAASVSEAYEIKELIQDLDKQKDYFKVINTGTIDRYCSLWGIYDMRYIKSSYKKPIISKETLNKYSKLRYEQSSSTKIIVAGMTGSKKELECYLDEGEYLAGKSTTLVISKGTNPKLLLAILNSRLISYIYRNLFKDLGLNGGCMRVGPPQIKRLPIKLPDKESEQREIVGMVEKLHKLYEESDHVNPQLNKGQKIKEDIDNLAKEIDQKIYSAYRLSKNEIKVIEES